MPFRWSGSGQEERMRFDGVVKSFYETDRSVVVTVACEAGTEIQFRFEATNPQAAEFMQGRKAVAVEVAVPQPGSPSAEAADAGRR
jgi:hypothetical protein